MRWRMKAVVLAVLCVPPMSWAQLGEGTGGIVNPSSTTIGKMFTTEDTGSGKWTERAVLVGTSTADYLAEHEFHWLSNFSPNTPAQADAERDAYIASLTSSMSAEIKYYWETPPSTEANTPTSYSTKMYRVKALNGTSWDDEGLLFREYNGNTFHDFWLLESAYDSHTQGEKVWLEPITSGSQYYTDRKDYIESEGSSHAHFIETFYTFVED